ncbi:AI-2E family transporter [Arthrobacter frigidicola]|nr:AI-2E family transporter [Arthrobacter frigidicola]
MQRLSGGFPKRALQRAVPAAATPGAADGAAAPPATAPTGAGGPAGKSSRASRGADGGAPARRGRPAPQDDVPYALRVGAAWSWRVGIVVVVAGVLIWLLSHITLIVIPLMIAGLLASLLLPLTSFMVRHKVPTGLAVTLTVLGLVVLVVGALSLVGRQLALGFSSLWGETRTGIEQILAGLSDGPLNITTDEVVGFLQEAGDALQNNGGTIVSGALSFGSSAGHFAAGSLLTLFALFFFLIDGGRIWRFIVDLAPVRARAAIDGAGRRGWTSMGSYVRVQLLVAFVDAACIGAGAAIIGVPLALPLAVLVFIGSFIPIVGALATGIVAVLLALVANGWVNALIMLAIVLIVQQLEGNFLQPMIMGPAVALHPLAVVLAVTGGTLVAGISGALFSVPLLAVLNTSVKYIARRAWETDPALNGSHPAPGPLPLP